MLLRDTSNHCDVPGRRSLPRWRLAALAAICFAATSACISTAPPANDGTALQDLATTGRDYARLRCAGCHAIDQEEFGANPEAPPMKRILPKLAFKMLERQPGKRFDMVHGSMPPLHLSSVEREALEAYLRMIANPPVR